MRISRLTLLVLGLLLVLARSSNAQEIEEIHTAKSPHEVVEILEARHEARLQAARDLAEQLRPFQDEVITIEACDENSAELGIEWDTPTIGRARAFRGEGRLARDQEMSGRFWISPKETTGRRQANGVVLYPQNQWLAQRQFEAVNVATGPLSITHKIPLFGSLYSVTTITPRPVCSGAKIKLRRVEKVDWPEGISIDPFAYAVTNGGALRMGRHGGGISISAEYSEAEKKFKMTVTAKGWNSKFVGQPDYREWRFVDKDDRLSSKLAPQTQFRVIRIVPPDPENPDPKKRVPGWVELRQVWPLLIPFGTESSPRLNP